MAPDTILFFFSCNYCLTIISLIMARKTAQVLDCCCFQEVMQKFYHSMEKILVCLSHLMQNAIQVLKAAAIRINLSRKYSVQIALKICKLSVVFVFLHGCKAYHSSELEDSIVFYQEKCNRRVVGP